MLIVFSFSRKVDSILMDKFIGFDCSILLTLIMFLSEIISGLILFLYYNKFLSKKEDSDLTKIKIKLKKYNINDYNIKIPDSNVKIYFLI